MKTLAKLMTADEVKADEMKNYNEREWIKTVDRYLKYDDVQFYKVGKDKIYSYDRFFVVYTLPEGLRLMASMDYSSSLSSGGFAMVDITTIELFNTEDADPNNWVIKHLPEGYVYLIIRKFNSPNGEQVRLNNSREARKFMIEGSTKYKTIYTKE
jgi:hypothetical protein